MANDGYDDIGGDDREGSSGAGGAILGVLMTLAIGSGLVFAAYKLGQRTNVDDAPILRADSGEAKMVPLDEGGLTIANQDNDAYTMIDESPRGGTASGEADGILVTDRLPARELNPTSALAVTAAQQDALRIDELQPSSTLARGPSLTDNTAPDRTPELQLSGGAEVTQVAEEALLQAAENGAGGTTVVGGGGAQVTVFGPGSGSGSAGDGGSVVASLPDTPAVPSLAAPTLPLTRAPDTSIAVAPAPPVAPGAISESDFGPGLVFPVPRVKPDLGPSISSTGRAPVPAPAPASTVAARPNNPVAPSAAVATTVVPGVAPVAVPIPVPVPVPAAPAPLPGQVVAPTLQAQPVRAPIPAQPAGDAQVQLGAMPSPSMVRSRWGELQARHPDLLNGLGIQVQAVRTNQGQELHRLRAGPLPTTQAAAQLCSQLRVRGVECFVPARR